MTGEENTYPFHSRRAAETGSQDLADTAARRQKTGRVMSSTLDIYCSFFGLSERPFSLLPDPAFLYWSPQHSRAYTMLEYGLLTHAPITLR